VLAKNEWKNPQIRKRTVFVATSNRSCGGGEVKEGHEVDDDDDDDGDERR